MVLIAALTGLEVLELRAEEPRRAIIAMEMLMSGEPVVLQLNGYPYLNKPPLYSYVMATGFWILGSFEEWAVRLPGVLSYILLAVLSARWFARYTNRITGLLTFFFLMTCWDMLFYGLVNAGEIDLFYALITFIQVMAIFHFEQKQQPLRLFIISYIFMALGCLTKGMPSMIFQGLTLLGWLIWQKKWRWLIHWKHAAGLLSAGVLLGGYFYLYAQRMPLRPYLLNLVFESFEKSTGDSDFIEILKGMAFFPVHLIKLTLPWSLLLGLFFWKRFRKVSLDHPLISFALLFCAINLIPYWLSPETRGRYLYMFFPFFFVGIAYWWSKMRRPSYRWIIGIVLLTSILRIGYSAFIMPLQQNGTLEAGLIYRNLTDDLLEKTEGQHIYLYGRPDTIRWPAWLNQNGKNYVLSPPRVAYQIPYYLMLETGEIMQYDTVSPSGNYLLKFEEDSIYGENSEVLYRFEERIFHKNMELIHLSSGER